MTEKKNINCSFLGRIARTFLALVGFAVTTIYLACWKDPEHQEDQEDLVVIHINLRDILRGA